MNIQDARLRFKQLNNDRSVYRNSQRALVHKRSGLRQAKLLIEKEIEDLTHEIAMQMFHGDLVQKDLDALKLEFGDELFK